MSTSKIIEVVAVMPKYNPFFEKAGMTRVDTEDNDMRYQRNIKRLDELGFNTDMVHSITYCESHYNTLSSEHKELFKNVMIDMVKRYNGVKGGNLKIDNLEFTDTKFRQNFSKLFKSDLLYLYRINENYTEKKINTLSAFF